MRVSSSSLLKLYEHLDVVDRTLAHAAELSRKAAAAFEETLCVVGIISYLIGFQICT